MIIGGAVEDVGKAVEGDTRAETVVVVGEAVEDVGVDTGTTVLNWKPLTMVEVGLEAVVVVEDAVVDVDEAVVAGVTVVDVDEAVGAGVTVVVARDAVEDVGVDTGTILLNRKPLTMVEVGLEAVRAAVGCATTKDVGGVVVAGVVTTTVGDAVGAGADTESSPPGI